MHPGLVAGLRKNGRSVDDLTAAQIVARLVPGANYGVPLTVSPLERSTEVAANAGDGADFAARRAAKQDPYSVDLDPTHAVLQPLLLQNRHELVGSTPLEDVSVDPQDRKSVV